MTDVQRPQPTITDLNRPFWDAASRQELRLQRCTACGLLRYPIASVCPNCLAPEAEWELLSGHGTVYSTVVFHQLYNQAFADQVPYNVSIVELDEGPRLMTNVVGVDPSSVRVGQTVRAVFTPVGDGIHLPQFVPEP